MNLHCKHNCLHPNNSPSWAYRNISYVWSHPLCWAAFVYCSFDFSDLCLWALISSCCSMSVIYRLHIFLTLPLLVGGNKCDLLGKIELPLWTEEVPEKFVALVEFCPSRIWAESSVNGPHTPTSTHSHFPYIYSTLDEFSIASTM